MTPADRTRLPVEATPGADKGSMGPLSIGYYTSWSGGRSPVHEGAIRTSDRELDEANSQRCEQGDVALATKNQEN
jgi:hypothetical protein